MGNYKVLQISDLHLDQTTRLAGQLRYNADGMNVVMEAARDAVREMILRTEPNVVIYPGDLFTHSNPTAWEIAAAKNLLGFWPSVVISGNHETPQSPTEPTGLIAIQDMPNVTVVTQPQTLEFGPLRIGFLPYYRKGGLAAAKINGVQAPDPASALRMMAAMLRSQEASVLVAHYGFPACLTGAQPRPLEEYGLPMEALEWFDGIMLGHIHRQQKWNDHPFAWMAGSPYIKDWGEINDPPKGGVLWSFDGTGKPMSAEPIVAIQRYKWENVLIEADVDLDRLREKLLAPVGTNSDGVYRVEGAVPGDVATMIRQTLATCREAGALVQDKISVIVEDRIRDATLQVAQGERLSDDVVVARALRSRDVIEEQTDRCMAHHAKIVEEVEG